MAAVFLPPASGEDLTVDFYQKRHALQDHDIAGRMSLASWCERNGLPWRAAELYHEVLELDGEHHGAYDRLVRLTDTRRLPEQPERQKALLDHFGDDFELHVAPHYLVVYNTDKAWAINRAVLLERTHHLFTQAFRRGDFRVVPLKERLVCLLLADHDQFTAYAREADGVDVGWSAGYYSSKTNRTAFFDETNSPNFRKVTDRVARLEKVETGLREKLRAARRARSRAHEAHYREKLDAVRKELRWYRNRHSAVADMGNAAKTTHEAAHQFAFNMGLQVRGHMYPFWLSEGIATNFETVDPAAPFGPHHDNPGRRRLLTKAWEAEALLPMDAFIVMVRPPVEDERRLAVAYSQAWGLFRFLLKYRRAELQDYLDAIAAGPRGERSPQQRREAFDDAFGELSRIEREFELYVKRLR